MSQLIGHEPVVSRFSQAVSGGSLHHAWLLHGVGGIGKSLLAERLAATLLCEERCACGTCHACLMLAAGSHPDLFRVGLVEKKRDISIDQVRELLGFMALSGAQGERRVVILDDAERLNHQAANALLKGLEEPADGSVLLMVCDDAMRLPATVRSRCLLQHCAPLTDDQVRSLLAEKVDPSLLDLAVALADGCPGAVSCMEDKAIASALEQWQQLTSDLLHADIGALEAWCRSHVATVPHTLIVRAMVMPLEQQVVAQQWDDFTLKDAVLREMMAILRWPSDVVRQSLRAAPTLLAHLLAIRSALRNAG